MSKGTDLPAIDVAFLLGKATEIAAALGDGWRVEKREEPSAWYACLEKPGTEAKLDLHVNDRERRVRVMGCWPVHEGRVLLPRDTGAISYSAAPPVITVSIDRPAVAIARSIQLRLLGRYLEILAKVLDWRAARVAERAAADHILARLAKVLGTRPAGQDKDRISASTDEWSVDGHVRPSGTVQLELSVDADTAERLLRALVTWSPR